MEPPPTPITSKSICRLQREYKVNPSIELLKVIFRSQERLAVQHEINKHVNSGIIESIEIEKKRRRHGKKLNLVGEEDNGAQFFHTAQVCLAIAVQAEKEAVQQAKKTLIAAKKIQAKENKEQKQVEIEERAIQCQIAKNVRAQNQAEKQAAKEAKKNQPKLLKTNKKQSLIVKLPYKKASNSSNKVVRFVEDMEVVAEVERVHLGQTCTRSIILPARYKN